MTSVQIILSQKFGMTHVSIVQKADRPSAEIACLTGFNAPSYFTRLFSKKFGDLRENFRK